MGFPGDSTERAYAKPLTKCSARGKGKNRSGQETRYHRCLKTITQQCFEDVKQHGKGALTIFLKQPS